MFIWDLVVVNILGQFLGWIYAQIIAFLSEFLTMMNVMGVELFELDWVKGIVLFFSHLAWSLYITRLVIALFETVIKMQSGKGSFRDLGLNAIKGFIAVSLFSIVPIEALQTKYKFTRTTVNWYIWFICDTRKYKYVRTFYNYESSYTKSWSFTNVIYNYFNGIRNH